MAGQVAAVWSGGEHVGYFQVLRCDEAGRGRIVVFKSYSGQASTPTHICIAFAIVCNRDAFIRTHTHSRSTAGGIIRAGSEFRIAGWHPAVLRHPRTFSS